MSEQYQDEAQRPTRNWWLWGSLALAALILGGLYFSGDGATSARSRGRNQVTPEENLGRNLFDSATDTLDRLEQFDTDPALRLVLDRLNQWIRLEEPADPWKLDPLVETLPAEPKELKGLPLIQTAGELKFVPDDGNHLLETSWLRNIARTARGSQTDELSRATRLFDWTVRNIQLEDWSIREGRKVSYRPAMLEGREKKEDISYLARDVLLFGRGDYVQRAWVFMLLARQENLDVVLLAVPDKNAPQGLRPWLPALVQQDKLYLFDTYLGLPLPGPGKDPVTLDQLLADPTLLSALDSGELLYPLESEQLKGVVALVDGSPAYLSRRMQAVEDRLAGAKKVVLFATPSTVADKVRGLPGISEVRLWAHPYQVLVDRQNATPEMMQTIRAAMAPFMIRYPTPRMRGRAVSLQEEHPLFMGQSADGLQPVDESPLEFQWCSLWMARMMHFKGIYTSDGAIDGANLQYLTVMVKDSETETWIERFLGAAGPMDPARSQQFRATMREVIPLAKQNATYWLGLIAQDRNLQSAAVDFFQRAKNPEVDGPWRYGANYNLARTYEIQAEQTKDAALANELLDKAISLLKSDDSAQALGNQLRARSLQTRQATAATGS